MIQTELNAFLDVVVLVVDKKKKNVKNQMIINWIKQISSSN